MKTTQLIDTKIKVSRVQLIDALEAKLKSDTSNYAAKLAAWEKKVDKAVAELHAAMDRKPSRDQLMRNHSTRYANLLDWRVTSKVEIPPKPFDVACDLRNTIATLRLSSEPTVLLSPAQYAVYFPCQVDDGE